MKIKFTILCSALLVFIESGLRAQNFGATLNCVTNPPDFSKLTYEEANKATYSETRRKTCPEYTANLVNQIRYGKLSNDNKVLAIFLLGELRPSDTNSLEVFIEDIDFKASRFDEPAAFPRWGLYPAEEALMYKVGKPAVNPILNHLPSETNELRRQLMCDVLKQVLRDK